MHILHILCRNVFLITDYRRLKKMAGRFASKELDDMVMKLTPNERKRIGLKGMRRFALGPYGHNAARMVLASSFFHLEDAGPRR